MLLESQLLPSCLFQLLFPRAFRVEWFQLEMPVGTIVGISKMGEVGIQVASRDRDTERDRLDKQIAKIETELRTVESKLKNKSFVDRAPTAIVEENRQRLKDFSAQLSKLKQAREGLN